MGSVAIPQSVVLKVVTLASVWIIACSVSSVLNWENFGERRNVGDTFGSEVCCIFILCVINELFTCICFITDDVDSASSVVSKYRKPNLNEVVDVLKEKSPYWFDIGSGLGVPLHIRESLSHNVHYTSDHGRLEKVLSEWLSTTNQSLVTWEEFIRVLTDGLNYMDIVDKTNTFLQNI